MKLLKSFTLILTLIIASSCSSDDDNTDSDAPQNGQLVATVDGDGFTASDTNAMAAIFGGVFNITALDNTGNSIVISVTQFNNEGTYDLSASVPTGAGVYLPVGADNSFTSLLEGGSGSITVSEYNEEDATISGTFSYTAVREVMDTEGNFTPETVEITGGVFTKLSVATSIPTGNNDNVLNAVIDGEEFSADNVIAIETSLSGQTTISIVANDTNTNQNIGISFGGQIIVGTFDLESFPSGSNYTATYNPDIANQAPTFTSQSGSTITIASYNETTGALEGSFQFTAGDPIQQDDTTYAITEGSFSVTIN